MNRLLNLFIFAWLFAGCADVPSSHPPSASEQVFADALVDQVRTLGHLSEQPQDIEALFAATNGMPAASALATAVPEKLPDCLVQTSASATFTDCEIGNDILDGSLLSPFGRLSARLVHIFIAEHVAITVEATLYQEGDAVSGTISTNVVRTAGESDETADITIRIDELILAESGCPIGGSISLLDETSFQTEDVVQTFWFGPTCGDLLVAP